MDGEVTSDDIGPDGIGADTGGMGMVVETIMKGVGKVLGGSKREIEEERVGDKYRTRFSHCRIVG